MYYNLSTYEPRQKFGHKHLGKQSYGQSQIIHPYNIETTKKKKQKKRKRKKKNKDIDVDNFVDALLKKTSTSFATPVTDFGRHRQDNAGPAKNQPLGLMEYKGTKARSGISPFPQRKHSGGPIGTGGSHHAFKTGNYRRIGTQYGSSRPHKLLGNYHQQSIFNLSDMIDPMERSFLRQQNRIKKLFKLMNEQSLG